MGIHGSPGSSPLLPPLPNGRSVASGCRRLWISVASSSSCGSDPCPGIRFGMSSFECKVIRFPDGLSMNGCHFGGQMKVCNPTSHMRDRSSLLRKEWFGFLTEAVDMALCHFPGLGDSICSHENHSADSLLGIEISNPLAFLWETKSKPHPVSTINLTFLLSSQWSRHSPYLFYLHCHHFHPGKISLQTSRVNCGPCPHKCQVSMYH